MIFYPEIDTSPGQSGSGVILKNSRREEQLPDPIIGIHTGSNGIENGATTNNGLISCSNRYE